MRIAVLLALLLLPTGARAATVSAGDEISFAAGAGEANRVTLTWADDLSSATVRDAGATLTAGAGCQAIDDHTARCDGDHANVALGDGNDRLTSRGGRPATSYGAPGTLAAGGGAGNDRLTGAPGLEDILDGGRGADRIAGRGGNRSSDVYDVLRGGAGPDVMIGSGDPEALDAGTGIDRFRCRGDEVLYGVTRRELIPKRCRAVGKTESLAFPAHPERVNASAVRFPNAPGGPMRLRAPNGVLFGKASIEPHHTRVPLTAAGRRALARHAMVVITFLHVTWRTRL